MKNQRKASKTKLGLSAKKANIFLDRRQITDELVRSQLIAESVGRVGDPKQSNRVGVAVLEYSIGDGCTVAIGAANASCLDPVVGRGFELDAQWPIWAWTMDSHVLKL